MCKSPWLVYSAQSNQLPTLKGQKEELFRGQILQYKDIQDRVNHVKRKAKQD